MVVRYWGCLHKLTSHHKAALCLPLTSMKLPASEFKPCTSRFCLEEWQDIWNSAANNKLHAICPTVGKCVHNNLVSHRDAVIVNRLKIGHSRFTHSYLLSGEDQPKCDTALTVKHILLDWPELWDVRLKHFTASLWRTSPATPWDAAGEETDVTVVVVDCCGGCSCVEGIALDATTAALFSSLKLLLVSTSLLLPASAGGTWDPAALATLRCPSVISICWSIDLSWYGRDIAVKCPWMIYLLIVYYSMRSQGCVPNPYYYLHPSFESEN